MSAVSAVSEPYFRITHGTPTDEELAALTAVLTVAGRATAAPTAAAPPPVRGRWNDPAHLVRRSWTVGPGGWRAAH